MEGNSTIAGADTILGTLGTSVESLPQETNAETVQVPAQREKKHGQRDLTRDFGTLTRFHCGLL